MNWNPYHWLQLNAEIWGWIVLSKQKEQLKVEIIRQLIEHIESEHDIPVLTADTLFRMKKGIKK